jgi:hypothetical protein
MRWDHVDQIIAGPRAVTVWMVTGRGADGEVLNYLMRAARHARTLIVGSGATQRTLAAVSDVVSDRFQILADLVQAYLADSGQVIEELPGWGDEIILSHPGFDGGQMNVSGIVAHLLALDEEGLIRWRRESGSRGGVVIIPTRVLEAPDVREARTGQEIMRVVYNQQTYHSSNVAYGGSRHTQTVNLGFGPGDLEGFIEALRELGVQEPELGEFREAAAADDGYERAQSIAMRISEGALGNALGTATYVAVTKHQLIFEAIQRFWGLL